MTWKPVRIISLVVSLTLLFFAFAYAVNLSTSVVTTAAVVTLSQNRYQWYENADALTPVTSLGLENSAVSTPDVGSVLRLRLNVEDTGVALASGSAFKLQYANSTSGAWTDVGTSTAAWFFFDNPSVADGQIIVTTVLSDSDVGESYGESNPSAATPNTVLQGQKGEWDWVLYNNSASTENDWFFRMIYSSSTVLDAYSRFPKLSAVAAQPPGGGGGGPPVGVGGGPGAFPSGTVPFGSSTPPRKPLPIPPPLVPPSYQCIDFNGDGRVDIVDLSILLYYYNEPPKVKCYDLNGNGLVDFPDVSILMFYWTA